MRPARGCGSEVSAVHRLPARAKTRAMPTFTRSCRAVATTNPRPVQVADTAPSAGSGWTLAQRPADEFQAIALPVEGETSRNRPPPNAATGSEPRKTPPLCQIAGGLAIAFRPVDPAEHVHDLVPPLLPGVIGRKAVQGTHAP